jgi:APA family basic amino acid/polyamine antiporter
MQETLRRALHTPQVLFLGINGVIGGGIFLLPGEVAADARHQALWAYLIAGAIVLLIGLAYAEASSMVTNTGGAYLYVEKAMGSVVGFAVGWMSWVTFVLGWAALSVGLVGYLVQLIPALQPWHSVVIVAIIGLLCLLNTLGVQRGALAVTFFSIVKLIPLLLLIVFGVLTLFAAPLHLATASSSAHFSQAVLLLIFAYGGFEMAAIPAGEMTQPRRSVVIGVIGTLVGVTIFYILIQWAAQRLDPHLASAVDPLTQVGRLMFLGGATVMTLGAALSILGTQSGVALASPRILYALAFHRSLPQPLARVLPAFNTPVVAIWTTGILVAVLALSGTFTHLILINVAARLFEYLFVAIAVVVLRLREPQAERRFKLPLGITIPVAAAILCAALLVQESRADLVAAAFALLIGLAAYVATRLTQRSAQSRTP